MTHSKYIVFGQKRNKRCHEGEICVCDRFTYLMLSSILNGASPSLFFPLHLHAIGLWSTFTNLDEDKPHHVLGQDLSLQQAPLTLTIVD